MATAVDTVLSVRLLNARKEELPLLRSSSAVPGRPGGYVYPLTGSGGGERGRGVQTYIHA